MNCPDCDAPTFVQQTVTTGTKVYRARKCSNKTGCGWLLTTEEVPCEDQYIIYKILNDKRKERAGIQP